MRGKANGSTAVSRKVCIFIRIFQWIERLIRACGARAMIANAKGDPLKQIRILLAGMPKLMIEILRHSIAAEPDMTVVEVAHGDDLGSAAQRMCADVVVVGRKSNERADYSRLLRQQPRLRVLTIEDSGKTGALYELRPRRIPLGEISAHTLSKAIRGRGPPGRGARATRRKHDAG